MKAFEEYVVDWFHKYLEDHEDIEGFNLTVFNTIVKRDENESLDDYLGKDGEPADFLMNMEADYIYEKIFGFNRIEGIEHCLPDLPSTSEFLMEMFKQYPDEPSEDYEFFDEFIEDMASECEGYNTPFGFFKDLEYGGCVSGMVGMLIYNSDCLKLYSKYADYLEAFKDELEKEIGCPIPNKNGTVHYVWICWLCYEELAHRIAECLYPDEF